MHESFEEMYALGRGEISTLPLYIYRYNDTKQEIQNFKNKFIYGIASVHKI